MCSPSAWSARNADEALRRLQQAILQHDSQLTVRNAEIAAIQVRFASDLADAERRIDRLKLDLEQYYTSHQAEIEAGGKKSLQLGYGLIGMRSAANPALVPLDEKWTWEKIGKKLKRLFKLRYFHAPKPPSIDKVKVKKELKADELAKCGLKLDDSESFYIELNQLVERKAA